MKQIRRKIMIQIHQLFFKFRKKTKKKNQQNYLLIIKKKN